MLSLVRSPALLDAHDLLGYARRRVEDDPSVCPLDDVNDFNAVLAVLAALAIEAEIEQAETARDLMAGEPDRRAELAARFRRQRGGS
jgi:hypothetical protein